MLSTKTFSLQGLWPQANGRSLPDCTGSQMDDQTLRGKKDDLSEQVLARLEAFKAR